MFGIVLGLGLLLCFVNAQETVNFPSASSEAITPAIPIVKSKTSGLETIILTPANPVYNIYSPGFPDAEYPPNVDSYYEVKIDLPDEAVQMGARILVTFEMFAIQYSKYCTNDGLEITQPNSQVKVYCASQSGEIFLSQGSSFEMRFFTDSTIQERGYNIRVEIYKSPCAKTIKGGSNGVITSPGFPTYYQNFELCVWKIVAPQGKRVRIGFNDVFNIQGRPPFCLNDFLQISRKGSFDQDLNRYCGTESPEPMFSEGNKMIIKFQTDCCTQNRGFSASYSFVDEEITTTTEVPIPNDCDCGKENILQRRIIGGETLSPTDKYPWMTGLHNEKLGVFCGGALISKQYIVTAAHCVSKETPQSMKVLLGGYDLQDSPDLTGVDKIIVNPEFDTKTYANDIALVRLKQPATFGRAVSPVCLPTIDFDTNNKVGKICGWGHTKESGDSSQTLLEGEVDTITLGLCKQKYGTIILDTNMCTYGNNTDACQGDSGGPLVSTIDGRDVLMGVISWGIGCGRDGYPGVYTKVSSYNTWIEQETQDAPACEPTQKKGPKEPNLEDCGLANQQVTSRVAGGYPTAEMEYPWVALISVDGVFKAVGTLISPRYVITATHWLNTLPLNYWQKPDRFKVTLGRYDLSKNSEPEGKTYGVSKITPDPNYGKSANFDRDFTIIKLSQDANTAFNPICLPRGYEKLQDGSAVYGVGWGRTSTNGDFSNVLREVDLLTVSDKTCAIPYQTKLTKNMMCAAKEGKGMCGGDGGAPLMAYYEGRYYLTGISSWGSPKGCAVKGEPDVFAAVNQNLAWINTVTGLKVGIKEP